jgi:hypothetical protein
MSALPTATVVNRRSATRVDRHELVFSSDNLCPMGASIPLSGEAEEF